MHDKIKLSNFAVYIESYVDIKISLFYLLCQNDLYNIYKVNEI